MSGFNNPINDPNIKLRSKSDVKKNVNKSIRKKSDKLKFDSPAQKQRILTVVNKETGEIEARINLQNRLERGGWFAFFQKSAVYLAQNLGKEELRVLMYMISKLDYGNYIRVTNKNIHKNLNMDHSNVARAIRKLIEKNVIAVQEWYGISRIYRMNPNFLHKGKDVYQTHKEYRDLREKVIEKFTIESLEMDEYGDFKDNKKK